MAQIILDTNVLIALWNDNSQAKAMMPSFKKYDVCITVFTYVEFLAAVPMRIKASARKFLADYPVITFTASSLQAAKNFAFTFQTPQPQFMDLLIASNVKGSKAKFYTLNIKDFTKYQL